MTAHIGIVGGGILGMTLALRLRRRGFAVTLVEGTAEPGGLSSPAPIGAYVWDRFYHVISPADTALLELLDDLGLGERVRWGRTRTGFYTDGRLYSLSSSIEFLRFPALGLVDKARLAATITWSSRIRDWRRLERLTAVEWLTCLSGPRVVARIWGPLLRSKLGGNWRAASAAFIWAIIARVYAARRSGMKRELFGYVEGGYAAILRRLREVLVLEGVTLRAGTPVRMVTGGAGGAELHIGNGTIHVDHAVLTVPCPLVADLCPGLEAAEQARLRGVVYQGVVCASFLLRRPLAGFYVTNITDEGFPFTGVIEMTALVKPSAFGGHTLVYLPRYVPQSDPAWQWSADEVLRTALDGLRRMYPSLAPDDVVASGVAQARWVQAIATLDYSAKLLPPLRTSVPGVYVVNSAQIVAGTLNNNEIVALAGQQSAVLGAEFSRRDVEAAA